jgi:putative phosphoribosyl transferase
MTPMPMAIQERTIRIRAGSSVLEGDLRLPDEARGLVLFAHGSGSSRHSPRNRFVAEVLNGAALGTLLVDLLTQNEEAVDAITGELRFDIEFLAQRLLHVTDWLEQQSLVERGGLGLFGSSTGAAAALVAAADLGDAVGAVVSRGGRPDLAGDALASVRAPTLLIVGSRDGQVLHLNQQALEQLYSPVKRLEIVPGATHLFEEPGALERVAELARDWFVEHLTSPSLARPGGEPARPG